MWSDSAEKAHFGKEAPSPLLPLGEVKLIESDWTPQRILSVLHHFQDLFFTLLLSSLRWSLWIPQEPPPKQKKNTELSNRTAEDKTNKQAVIYWRTRLILVVGDWRIEAQVSGLAIVPVGLGAPHDVGERQLPVLLHCGEAEVLAAEEEQGVEEDDGRVGAQLLAVPQELFLHAGINRACWEEEA